MGGHYKPKGEPIRHFSHHSSVEKAYNRPSEGMRTPKDFTIQRGSHPTKIAHNSSSLAKTRPWGRAINVAISHEMNPRSCSSYEIAIPIEKDDGLDSQLR
ncbi:hypothetical protein U1Q18_016757 [Sarracenia purpurea var. burkii]